jgi:hypothetical protein
MKIPKLYSQADSMAQLKIEKLHNIIFESFPSKLRYTDPLDSNRLMEFISRNFERLSSDLIIRDGGYQEASYWICKKGEYSGIIVEVTDSRMGNGFSLSEHLDRLAGVDPVTELQETPSCELQASCCNPEPLKEFKKVLDEYKIKTSESKIYLLTKQYGEIGLQPLDVPASTMDLALNYGDEFNKIHDSILSSLNNKISGLYLFYGEPGTGKSSYIKYLISGVLTRKVLYVPINLIDSLTSPDFLPLLIANKNLILVIEDAEKALISREENTGNSSVVSSILNLTDSFIGNTLNVTIMATFNTKKENIDKALLRKGRLKLSHEFCKLSKAESQKLVNSLNFNYAVEEPMTIAEIYNLNDDNRYTEEKQNDRVTGFAKID